MSGISPMSFRGTSTLPCPAPTSIVSSSKPTTPSGRTWYDVWFVSLYCCARSGLYFTVNEDVPSYASATENTSEGRLRRSPLSRASIPARPFIALSIPEMDSSVNGILITLTVLYAASLSASISASSLSRARASTICLPSFSVIRSYTISRFSAEKDTSSVLENSSDRKFSSPLYE